MATVTRRPPQIIYALWERTSGSHGRGKLKPAHSLLAFGFLGLLTPTHSRNQTSSMLGKSCKTLQRGQARRLTGWDVAMVVTSCGHTRVSRTISTRCSSWGVACAILSTTLSNESWRNGFNRQVGVLNPGLPFNNYQQSTVRRGVSRVNFFTEIIPQPYLIKYIYSIVYKI